MKPAKTDAFGRLRQLLSGIEPNRAFEPIDLHLGEQRFAVPTHLLAALETGLAWSQYPTLGGTDELRQAYAGWLERRFALDPGRTDGRIAIEPTPGSKQGIASAIQLAVARARARGPRRPSVVVPEPCYPTYRAVAESSGAELLVYDADDPEPANALVGRLAVSAAVPAAIVVCNPGNPTGLVLSESALGTLAELAARYAAPLIVDECYVDLWLDEPIDSALGLAVQRRPPCSILVLHTLSKRSAAPGLRSGFAAGEPALVAAYAAFNRACGVSLARPICAVSATLWQDDAHLVALRAGLAANWRAADAALAGVFGYARPRAGFFLWLPVPNGESAACRLWRDAAVRTLPGTYLMNCESEQGARTHVARERLRLALVHPAKILEPALCRVRGILADGASASVGASR